jgi:hypothetical protein
MLVCTAFAEGTISEFTPSSEEEILQTLGVCFGQTDEMSEISYQTVGTLAQMSFTLDDVSYTARIQPTSEFQDISEFSFSAWAISDECMIGWCESKAMMAQQDGEIFALCLWYDAAPGLMYSVSARVEDLKGLDIQKAAESVFAPLQDEADGVTSEDILPVLIGCTGYEGTAGSSLKEAAAACRLMMFAGDKQLADADEMILSEAAAGALAGLTEEQRAELSGNMESISNLLTAAFEDYVSMRDLFDTAGVAEEMDLLVAAGHLDHYTALYEALMAAGL